MSRRAWKTVSALVGGAMLATGALLAPGADAVAAEAGLKSPASAVTRTAGLTAALLGSTAFIALLAFPGLRRVVIPKPAESRLSDTLQFESILPDGQTLRLKDGRLVRTILLSGIDYSSKTDDEAAQLLNARHAWLMSMCKSGEAIKLLAVRERIAYDAEAEFDNDVLQAIHERWMASFQNVYQNRHYIVISVKEDRKSEKKINDLTQSVLALLHQYGPKVLENGGLEAQTSPLLTMWASLVNGFYTPIPPAEAEIAERLPQADIHFDNESGVIHSRLGVRERYAQILSVQRWGEEADSALIESLMSLPGRVQVLQAVYPLSKGETRKKLYLRSRQESLFGLNRTKQAEFEAVEEMVGADIEALIPTQFSVLLAAERLDDLDSLVSEAQLAFADARATAVIETTCAEWIWRCRLPGFGESEGYVTRPRQLLTRNVVDLMAFQEEPGGRPSSDWGEGPIRVFKTVSGAPYAFQFHISESSEALAHTVTYAPAGSGKTTLLEHLVGGAVRHQNLAAYLFDRYNGMEIFTRAVGGVHIDPIESEIELNPLQMAGSQEDRQFLRTWLMRLANVEDDQSDAAAARAVEAIFKIRRASNRSLRGVFDSAFDTGSPLKAGLKRWVGDDVTGATFNGKSDGLALDQSRIVTFEMASALKDARLAGALVSYIMHRIRQECRVNARPHLVVIDETAAMLSDPAFQKDVEVLLREHRKLRGSVNLVFQDVGGMRRSGIAEVVLNNCPTSIVFQNPNANRDDYQILDLTDGQWEYIKGQSRIARHLPRSVLVKRGQEAVILDVDLSPLGPLLKVYRSGAEPVRIMHELRAKFGAEQWLSAYVEDARV